MLSAIRDALSAAAPQDTPQVTPQVIELLEVVRGETSRAELQAMLGLRDRKSFFERYLRPALPGPPVDVRAAGKTSSTFVANAGIFGKVYFPRLVTPLSIVISNLIQFAIQFLLFFAFLGWFAWKGASVHPDWAMILLLTPILLGLMAFLGLGIMMFKKVERSFMDTV